MTKRKEKKLKTRTFANEKRAIVSLMKLMKEKGHCSLRHSLDAKQKTLECKHQADSWIILPNGIGRCIIAVEGYLDETFEFFQNRSTAVFVPAKSDYSLEGLSPNIFYSVLSRGLF